MAFGGRGFSLESDPAPAALRDEHPQPAKMSTKPDGRWWSLLGILVLVTHASLFGVGAVGEDFQVLVEASRAVHPELGGGVDLGEDLFDDRPGTRGRPLAALSLGASSWLWTSEGVWTHFALGALRFENLLLLTLTAWFLVSFLRRLIGPWTGSEHANAASWAAFMMLLVHPLSVAAVASPAARGDLLGGALGMLAGAAFLRGRQERRYGFVLLAGLAALAATLASELGFLVPLWLAVLEFTSARRYRPRHVRLRTAFTTLVAFGAIAGLDVALRVALEVDPWPVELQESLFVWTDVGDLFTALFFGLTKLGVLILPVNGANAGGLGFVIGAVVLVLVVQPALHAGLSAPRFWVTALGVWLSVIVLIEATRATLEVGPGDFSGSAALFPAVVVMAIGFSLAATAVSGTRRQVVPLVVACLLCTLARSNARGWRAAAKDADELSHELAELVDAHGPRGQFLVLDPPGLVDLFEACPQDLAWMVDRAITGRELRAEDVQVDGLGESAFRALSRLDLFDEMRGRGLVAVFWGRLVDPGRASARWVAEPLTAPGGAGQVLGWRNAADGPRTELAGPHWTGVDDDVPVYADSASIECLTVRLAEGVDPLDLVDDMPEVVWRARGGIVRKGELYGVWLIDGEGLTAVFDPGSELSWLLGPRIDSLLLVGELAEAAGAEAWKRPPSVGGLAEPAVDRDDWHFGDPAPLGLLDPELEESWRLVLLDLDTFDSAEVLCRVDGEGALVAPGAEELAQELRTRPGSLAWGLERRVEGRVLERLSGRL